MIRLPAVARVPQAPKGLLGLANLRGTVLPVASLRGLLGWPERRADAADARAIVLDGARAGRAGRRCRRRAGDASTPTRSRRARPSSPPSRASG